MDALPEKHSTILVVDDEQINIQLINDALSPKYRIIFAIKGEQALENVKGTNQPDLILLDVLMPGIDGYEVCRELKKDKLTKDIPVIFISSLEEEGDETLGFEVGAVDFIRKPIRKAIVQARVKLHLELKRQMDFHARRSLIDGLTEIANRRRLMEHLALELRRAQRNRSSLTVVMLDIDFFKLFNDNYGHIEGDECLKLVAEILFQRMKRPSDLVGRYGGEEFVCVLPETDLEGARDMCQLLLDSVEQLEIPHEYSTAGSFLTVSMGSITLIPGTEQTTKDLLEFADKALYHSKHSGRNQYTCNTL